MEDKNPNKHYSEILREERQKVGMSQAAVAKAVGVSDAFISDVENRNRKGTTQVKAIAIALGMSTAKAVALHKAAVAERFGGK